MKRLLIIILACVISVTAVSQPTNSYLIKRKLGENFSAYLCVNYLTDGFSKRIEKGINRDFWYRFQFQSILSYNCYFDFSLTPCKLLLDDSSYTLYEYYVGSDYNCVDAEDTVLIPLMEYSPLMSNGLIAHNSRTDELIYVSGFLFLDDLSDVYTIRYNEKSIRDYIKMRYFNYEVDGEVSVDLKKKTVEFYSKKEAALTKLLFRKREDGTVKIDESNINEFVPHRRK